MSPAQLRSAGRVAAWLASELVRVGWAGRHPEHIEIQPLDDADTPRVVRAVLDYGRACRRLDGTNPASVIVKLSPPRTQSTPSHERRRRERSVYRTLLPRPGVSTPRAAVIRDRGARCDALLLSDVTPVRRGDPAVGVSIADARVIVDRLASVHASFWRREVVASRPWLSAAPRGRVPADWWCRIAHTETPAPMLARAAALLDTLPEPSTERVTLVHGDPVADNFLFDPFGVTLVDWEHAHLGAGVDDLALLLAGSLPATTRRHYEWELHMRYHAALVRGGVSGYDVARCWADYRAAMPAATRTAVAAWAELDAGDARRPGRALVAARCAEALVDHADADAVEAAQAA